MISYYGCKSPSHHNCSEVKKCCGWVWGWLHSTTPPCCFASNSCLDSFKNELTAATSGPLLPALESWECMAKCCLVLVVPSASLLMVGCQVEANKTMCGWRHFLHTWCAQQCLQHTQSKVPQADNPNPPSRPCKWDWQLRQPCGRWNWWQQWQNP